MMPIGKRTTRFCFISISRTTYLPAILLHPRPWPKKFDARCILTERESLVALVLTDVKEAVAGARTIAKSILSVILLT
jgi:hypothetical protein